MSRFSSNLSHTMHCRASKALGTMVVLFGFEGEYQLLDGKSARVGVEAAISKLINPDQLIQSRGCRCFLASI